MKRIAVLVSGSGSNLQALIDACADDKFGATIVLVVSNRADAFALERAKRISIATLCLPRERDLARVDYDRQLADRIAVAQPDLVVLAGWMHILSSAFLDRCPAKVINLHPALPGAFPGTHAIERALAAYRRGEIAETGVMVHEVIPEIDAGPVLGTSKVAILPTDDLALLSARMHAAEHRLLVDVVRRLIEP
jgi:phosphoribosylglycinamide formyltransferase 1